MSGNLRVGIVGAVSSYSLHYGQSLSEMDGVDFVGMAHLGRDPKYIRDALNLPWLAKYPKTVEAYAERFGAAVVVHPWMLMINPGEVQVVKDVIRYAKDEGAWFVTVKGLIELVGE